VTGLALLAKRRQRSPQLALAGSGSGPIPPRAGPSAAAVLSEGTDARRLAKDQRWFVLVSVVKVALGLVAFAVKPWLGLLFFAAYAVYFWRELRAGDGTASSESLAPLKLQRRVATPAAWAVGVQTAGAIAVIFFASQLFVSQLGAVAPMLGLSSTVTALLLAPIATELPEIMNAIIWARQGKIHLALANISGAMMIQATVPSGFGLLFTSWRFDAPLMASGVITMVAILYLLITLRARRLTPVRLACAGLLYLVFGALLMSMVI